jgi:hypothetical protein
VQICRNIVYYPKDGSFSFHWKTRNFNQQDAIVEQYIPTP